MANINIGGRLHSVATGNVVAGANEIIDDNNGKRQSEVNSETYTYVQSINNALGSLSPTQGEALNVSEKANSNEAKLGYYVCDTGSNVAAKAIAAPNYQLSTGGAIKIKMNNLNTASDATLNVNSTGAKPLYYNGKRASIDNSWEQEEVVEAYYDGTNWNVTGEGQINKQLTQIGSKIGDLSELETTDKSSLVNALNEVKNNANTTAANSSYTDKYGIGATNVQDAIDKVGFVGTDTEIDLTQYTEQRAYITPDAKWITTNNTYPYYGIFVPVTAGDKYRVTANSTANTFYTYLTSNTVGSNNATVTTFAGGATTTIRVEAGEISVSTAPADAKYMWFFNGTDAGLEDMKPQKIELVRKSAGEYLADIDDVPTRDSNKLVTSGGVYGFKPVSEVTVNKSSGDFEVHNKTVGVPNWISYNNAAHIVMPVSEGDEVSILCQMCTTGDGNWYAWLTESYTPPTSESAVPYAQGTTRMWGTLGTTYSLNAPSGAAYLLLGVVDGSGNQSSWSIEHTMYRQLEDIISDLDSSKASYEYVNETKDELEDEIEHSKYSHKPFDDVWSTNGASTIEATRDGEDIIIHIYAQTGKIRCGFDISGLDVGETIYVDFTSPIGVVFGVGEQLNSDYIDVGTYNSSFYYTKTRTTDRFIYVPAYSYSTGTTLTLTGFKVYKAISVDGINETVEELKEYSFMPSSYIPIKETYEMYMNISLDQGCAVYGSYFVSGFAYGANKKYIKIYDLQTKTLSQQVDLPTLPNTRYHANTISFSGTKYDSEDEFPLLYLCSGYTTTTSVSASQVYVLRIVGTAGSWTTELVQTITLDFGNVNGWTEWVCDPVLNRAWINGSGIDKYICVAIPSISESEVTIDANTAIIDHFNTKSFTLGLTTKSSGQGRFFYHNRIYWVSGVPSYAGEGDEALYVVVDNTLTHCTEAVVPLKNFGLASGTSNTYEPEGCFIWNDEFYVAYRTFIARLIQN